MSAYEIPPFTYNKTGLAGLTGLTGSTDKLLRGTTGMTLLEMKILILETPVAVFQMMHHFHIGYNSTYYLSHVVYHTIHKHILLLLGI